jgi:putative phage-type endonuclease
MKKNNVEQRSPEWHQLRKTNITGTVLKGIMGTARARQEAIYESIANHLTIGVDDEEYENPMERGTRLEPDAIAEFEFLTGKSVEKVGFCESEEIEGVAQSPDGYIKDTNDTEAIEVKSMGGKNHVKLWLTNEVPDEYEWQVVQYFVVNEKLKKLYFVGYNPQIPTHPLHTIEILRENIESKITEAKEKQKIFIQEVESILKNIIKF